MKNSHSTLVWKSSQNSRLDILVYSIEKADKMFDAIFPKKSSSENVKFINGRYTYIPSEEYKQARKSYVLQMVRPSRRCEMVQTN